MWTAALLSAAWGIAAPLAEAQEKKRRFRSKRGLRENIAEWM